MDMGRLLSLTFCLALGAHFLFQSSAFAEEIDYGIIRYVKGELFLQAKGEKARKPAHAHEKFYDGSALSTGPKSFAILKLPDGSTLKLDPDSNLKVEGLIQKQGNAFKGTSYLILTVGGIMVDVIQKFSGPPAMEIETTNRVAFGVRGTTFYIFHDQESSDVWGTVYKGQVAAMDYMNDDSELINAGMSMAIVEGQVMTKPYKYRWAERLRWSFAEKDAVLDTNRINSAEERLKELQNLYQKLRARPKKKFLKDKKLQEKELGDGYRTSEGEYISNDASLYSAGSAGETPPPDSTVVPDATPTAAPTAAPTPVGTDSANVEAHTESEIVMTDDVYTPQNGSGTGSGTGSGAAGTPPPPAPPPQHGSAPVEPLPSEVSAASEQCALVGASSHQGGCSGNGTSLMTWEGPVSHAIFSCCVYIPTNGNVIKN
ncbi:MAG: hypothetical protein A2X86_08735 [Bdellovibrionales bacterium GWA2_49_15]|nr:MAG: hypothetical protein A2X86_08735 [Bdellovibrionales bacterium GWA2_49_15]HAZ13949.1 hypothetical protein [Bdellovibrionales bacterium]